jgi:hypothetical protein
MKRAASSSVFSWPDDGSGYRIVKLALPAALCSHGTLSLWSSTTAFELQVNWRQRGARLGAIFIPCHQVLKSLLDEGIGRFLCQIPHRSGALLLKFLVQHDQSSTPLTERPDANSKQLQAK